MNAQVLTGNNQLLDKINNLYEKQISSKLEILKIEDKIVEKEHSKEEEECKEEYFEGEESDESNKSKESEGEGDGWTVVTKKGRKH